MSDTAKAKLQEKPSKNQDPRLDAELADTFPASDPPSMTQPSVKIGAPDHAGRKPK
jgi:hypothetical protein